MEALRVSKKGKNIAFKLLELDQNEEGYYLDSFGQQISYKKIPTLKAINRKLPMAPIHFTELEKCANDIHYFMDNYVKIKTPKGVDYPDLRYYQLEFLNCIIQDENESIVGLLPRQSGKCAEKNTNITIRNKKTGIIETITMEEFHKKGIK